MLDKASAIDERVAELERKLSDPATLGNQREYAKLAKERAQLSEAAQCAREYIRVAEEIAGHKSILDGDDADLRELAKAELPSLQKNLSTVEEKLKELLTPRDPNDEKNVILEIRAGTGGEEASLFAGDLYRMYTRYAERHGFKIEALSLSDTGLGGIKEVIALVTGRRGALLAPEIRRRSASPSQRVPETEGSGRIHTSAVTVAVMPEADEVEVNINEAKDLRIDVMRASGPGGQSVNTTDSAVRITHIPSGMVIICRDEKSQHKNKARALKILRARLLEAAQDDHHENIAETRRSMVGTGDHRSERIRTYNFPQSRVTDHRVNVTIHQLDNFLDGAIDPVIDALAAYDRDQSL